MSQTQEKTITLPDPDEMMSRLVGVMDEPHAKTHLYPRIVEYAAGREVVANGVVMSILLPLEEYKRGLPPVTHAPLEALLPQYVTALVDDEEVRKDALDFIESAHAKSEQQREEHEAANPVEPREQLSWEDAQQLYAAIRKLAAVYDECVADAPGHSDGYREGENSPTHNQTQNGLFLEFYYGSPSKVWTPWGTWYFAAANAKDVEAFMSRLTTSVHKEEENGSLGCIGPVYAIHAIDGEELPEPVLLTDRRQYIDSEEARATWARLRDDWYASRDLERPMTLEEKWAANDAYLKERSAKEPPISDDDIHDLEGLEPLRGQVVKYTQDDSGSWRYCKLANQVPMDFEGGVFGYMAYEEVLPYSRDSGMYGMTDDRFEKRGMVVRPTTTEEVEGLKFPRSAGL